MTANKIKCSHCGREISTTFAWSWATKKNMCFLCWNTESTRPGANQRMQDFIDKHITNNTTQNKNETNGTNSI